jgi:hypothetical protein
VVKAAELTRRLGVSWELVKLGEFHKYLGEWDALFGVASHAHGMYQLEFYHQITSRVAPGSLLLSGSCGDWFGGADEEIREREILDSPDDVMSLFTNCHMNADSAQSVFPVKREGAQALLEANPRLRNEYLPRVVTAVRLDMAYLSYLTVVPASLGLRPRAPFLDMDLALRMLTLPSELRHKRRWEREFFQRHGVDLESSKLMADYRNTLNYQGMRRVPLKPLDEALLREVVRPDYVGWINRNVGSFGLIWEIFWRLGMTHGFRRAVAMLMKMGVSERRLPAYFAYLTLLPLQSLLQRRDLVRRQA